MTWLIESRCPVHGLMLVQAITPYSYVTPPGRCHLYVSHPEAMVTCDEVLTHTELKRDVTPATYANMETVPIARLCDAEGCQAEACAPFRWAPTCPTSVTCRSPFTCAPTTGRALCGAARWRPPA